MLQHYRRATLDDQRKALESSRLGVIPKRWNTVVRGSVAPPNMQKPAQKTRTTLPRVNEKAPRTLRSEGQMVLPTGVSPRIGQAFRQRFSGCGESRCANKLRLSAAMYAQMYAQSWGHSSGGVDSPYQSSPQHCTLPEESMPQVWPSPALTLSKVPSGGLARPELSLPQHCTLPEESTPQVCSAPTLTF